MPTSRPGGGPRVLRGSVPLGLFLGTPKVLYTSLGWIRDVLALVGMAFGPVLVHGGVLFRASCWDGFGLFVCITSCWEDMLGLC